MQTLNFHVEIAHQEWRNGFKYYWIQNLDPEHPFMFTCSMPSNWKIDHPVVGQRGYVKVDDVQSGDTYTDHTGIPKVYNCDQTWLMDFIPE